jgi:hypothetical protein
MIETFIKQLNHIEIIIFTIKKIQMLLNKEKHWN